MQYVALFTEEKHGFSVEFPDFPGCVTCGDTLDEAVDHAFEALAVFAEELAGQGGELPEPLTKKQLLALPEHAGKKAINVTVNGDGTDFEEFEMVMHAHLLGRIEKYCGQHGVSPADFLAVAAREAIKNDVFKD
ncbi:MAG: type II toxin-antitoxin system HicB family antitoxin [Desulfovibrionaceae bacterium]|nr:type II toxin-antitoxin system HicB family antitoxin [Desulfovibrionaceae bacterium]